LVGLAGPYTVFLDLNLLRRASDNDDIISITHHP